MKKEKSKVIFSILSSGVGICLILHLVVQTVTEKWQAQQTSLGFQILDQRIMQSSHQNFVQQFINGNIETSQAGDKATVTFDTTKELKELIQYFIEESDRKNENISKLLTRRGKLSKRIYCGKIIERILLFAAIILNIFTLYYGSKIFRLYKT